MGTRNLLRTLRPVDIAAGVYSAVYFAWLALHTTGAPTAEWIGSAAFYPLGPAVAWAYWRTSRVPGLDRRTSAAWLVLVASALLLAVSGTAWDLFLNTLAWGAYPPWVDHLETVSLLLVVPAVLVFPGRSVKGRGRTRFVLDTSLVVVAGSVVAVYFTGRIWLSDPAQQSVGTALTGPGIDWLVLVVAAVGAVQKRDPMTRRALGLLVLASTSYVVANYYYTIGRNGLGVASYASGDPVDGLWFAAWVLRWAAARWSWYAWSSGPQARAATGPTSAAPDEDGAFSYAVVAGSFILVTTQVFSHKPSFALLAFAAVVTTALMLARQFVELRENRRLLDEQLAQEARFRSLVEHSSDAVLIVDGEGVVTYASATAPAVFGDPAPIRAGVRLADVLREDDRAGLESALQGRGSSGRLLMHLPAGDLAWRDIEGVWTDQRHDPAVNGIVVNCRDVTNRRELERELRHAQKLDAVGQLAGGLAHDINNSLAIVRGYAELLKDELDPDSAAASDLAHIQHAVDRSASITRRVLAFSRRQVALPTALDLTAVVGELLPILRQTVTPLVRLRLELEPRLWPVHGDRGQMEQVLVNLAANARDAMPGGGVLSIATSNRVVATVSASTARLPPGDYVALCVRDEGVGMTPEVRERIFEPFFSTKSATGGMGLGLAMVQDIVQGSKGRIVVESAPDRGAVFTILLPRTEAPVVAHRDGAAPKTTPVLGKTVLIVDDEDKVRVVARRMLERHGYCVLEAAGALAALDIITDPSAPIDILLTDLVMPGLDGRQLIARCAVLRPSLPVVCMTGFAGDDDDPRGYGRNLVAILSKPFSADTLTRAVDTAGATRVAP
jgi:two-component system, cell cycle sensor histidine kinase and response regulator CckA